MSTKLGRYNTDTKDLSKYHSGLLCLWSMLYGSHRFQNCSGLVQELAKVSYRVPKN